MAWLSISSLVLTLLALQTCNAKSRTNYRSVYWSRYGAPFTAQCPANTVLAHVSSGGFQVYSGDRHWHFTCMYPRRMYSYAKKKYYYGSRRSLVQRDCYWTEYVGCWREGFTFTCPNNRVITGIRSVVSRSHKDRRFKVRCCKIRQQLKRCKWSNYINSYRKDFGFNLSSNQMFTGISSIYSSNYRDRRWRFKHCGYEPKKSFKPYWYSYRYRNWRLRKAYRLLKKLESRRLRKAYRRLKKLGSRRLRKAYRLKKLGSRRLRKAYRRLKKLGKLLKPAKSGSRIKLKLSNMSRKPTKG